MYEQSFSGIQRPLNLISRIGSEERVGESLSADTISLYARKIRQVASRVAGDKITDLTPEMLVRDVADRISGEQISRATARLEKSAALFWIAEQAQKLMDSGAQDLSRHENAYRDIAGLSTSDLPVRSANTSGQKLKAFPDEAVAILENAALTDQSTPLLHALLFVRANLHVGLRPIEWFNARIIDYQNRDAFGDFRLNEDGSIATTLALHVDNAKHSAIRGNGESRTILLDRLDNRRQTHLHKWMAIVNLLAPKKAAAPMTEAEFTRRVYGSMQRAIRRVLLKAGWVGKVPAIYSTRHQAVANAKADGQSQREIAALFGHSSTETAHRHYGKKFSGYSGRSMRASPESILDVRSTSQAALNDAVWSEPVGTDLQPGKR